MGWFKDGKMPVAEFVISCEGRVRELTNADYVARFMCTQCGSLINKGYVDQHYESLHPTLTDPEGRP